ncbi:MAG: CidA/LrgA family protein [Proteobacteria bacterium]|nr:CidA/LrgA family protein [Pseudomonadota bacterium]
MIGSLALIFFCQLVGEIISRLTKLPIPGPVIGMVILFCGLVLRKSMPSELETVTGFLHRNLPLLFVPAGVGVIKNLNMLQRYWAPFTGAIIIGTAVTIAVTGVVMQLLNRRHITDQKEQQS